MSTSALAVMFAMAASAAYDEGLPTADVRVDAARREVVVTVGPVHIPGATSYNHHPGETRLRFEWPVGGWARGYRLDLLDTDGRPLPREVLHHAAVANLARRQLAYPVAERLLAVGRETSPVMLPESMGIPMTAGQELFIYYALVNTGASPIDGAALRLTVAYTPERSRPPRDVFPVFFDANPAEIGTRSRSFDVPPGISTTTAEFTLPVGGRLRGLAGHLHDHAVEIRLEAADTGKVLARLKTKRHADGRLISVSRTRFPFTRGGLRLAADRRYRVVGVYDNPTAATIPAGAMAFLAGPFIPDDPAQWPSVDLADPSFDQDRRTLLGEGKLHEHAAPHSH